MPMIFVNVDISSNTAVSMLNLCYEYGVIHNNIFNSLKSCCLQVGHRRSVVSHMYLNDVLISLGLTVSNI